MCQTGYLTLKSAIKPGRRVTLGIANREVNNAIHNLLSHKIFNSDIDEYIDDAENVLSKENADRIIELLNSVLLSISYDKYPIDSESVLRAILQVYLQGSHLYVKTESHNAKGRSDLIVDFAKRRVVFELKFSKDGKDTDTKLNEAVSQLESRDYGRENLTGRELIRIACVFNADKEHRTITAYKAL